jgi:hypothetical protein
MTGATTLTKNLREIEIAVEDDKKKCQFSVTEGFYNKLQTHVLYLKKLDVQGNRLSREDWIKEAILERLEKERSPDGDSPPKSIRLTFNISKTILSLMEDSICFLKKLGSNSSKKTWVIEAIERKIKREEVKIQKILQERAPKEKDLEKAYTS